MRRRHALQIGAAWAMIPLVGCGASAPVPSAAPVAAGKDAIPGHETAAAQEATGAAGNEAPTAPGATSDAGKDAAADSAPEAVAKSSFTRAIARLGRNHGHLLVVGFEDVKAGAEKTYEVAAGSSGHLHSVTLSADEMKRLLAGQLVRTKSTTDRGHAHRVVVRCAPPVDPPEWVSVCKFTSSGKDEHEIVITAADFQKLTIGGPVTLHSTRDADDAHLHTVSIEHRPPKA